MEGSGLSQRAFAMKHDYQVRQFGLWVRRLASQKTAPAMLPIDVKRGVPPSIRLRSERGWTMSLSGDTPAAWLAELLRACDGIAP
jgi:hypothetical protein